jgi:hypothetical protein
MGWFDQDKIQITMKMLSLMKFRIIDHELCVCEYGLRHKNIKIISAEKATLVDKAKRLVLRRRAWPLHVVAFRVGKRSRWNGCDPLCLVLARVSSETSFVLKQPKLGPKLISALLKQDVCFNNILFVSTKCCLFRLFRYLSETPKQTEKNVFCFRKTNRKTTETEWVTVCFGSNWKKKFDCFEDTLLFAGSSEACSKIPHRRHCNCGQG